MPPFNVTKDQKKLSILYFPQIRRKDEMERVSRQIFWHFSPVADQVIVELTVKKEVSSTLLPDFVRVLDKVNITEKNLANIIKKNPNFFDENNNFSRLKYEKFLLTNQIDAPTFERRLKERELQNNLFNFISGGIYSPLFLTKKLYENETKKIEIVSDCNHSNSNIGDNPCYDTVFKEIEEEEKEERNMESKLDIISKSELLAEMPVLFRLAAKLVFLFESDSHPIKFILK